MRKIELTKGRKTMNTCIFMGRTTSDIELKATTSGVSVASFTIAVDRKYTPKGQERQTDFINCVAWRGTAEFISKWFKKGDMIAVTGELQTSDYTDKDGNKRKKYEVVVENAYFCGKKNENTAPDIQPEQASFQPQESDYEVLDDDCPF
jgi:single-strand DNA-binding protein